MEDISWNKHLDFCPVPVRADVFVHNKYSHSSVVSCTGREAWVKKICVFQVFVSLNALVCFRNEIQISLVQMEENSCCYLHLLNGAFHL